MTDEHRAKIANSNILNALIAAANGEIEMTSTRAQISLALLKKIMPDLSNVEHSSNPDAPVKIEIVTGVSRPAD